LDGTIFEETAQVLSQVCRRLVSVRRFAGNGFQDDRLQVARDLGLNLPGPWRLAIGNSLEKLRPVGLVEGGTERQQLVQCQSQTVNVATVVCPALQLFGSHVGKGSRDIARVAARFALEGFGQTEIGHPDHILPVDNQVGEFDIAVQRTLVVGILQSIGDLGAESRDAAPMGRSRWMRIRRGRPLVRPDC